MVAVFGSWKSLTFREYDGILGYPDKRLYFNRSRSRKPGSETFYWANAMRQ